MNLSIIIPAYNEEKLIQQTISQIQTAVSHTSPPLTYEIIVCDNNSTDNTAVLAQQAGAIITFEPENHISKARNKGAELAKGDWFLFIDADTYPTAGLMTDGQIAMTKPNILGCASTIKVVGAPFWYRVNLEGQNINMRLFKTCLGLFVMCRATVFTAIGGFSETLFAFEDLDFVNKLKKYGRKHHQSFIILHKHPVVTSGRKGHLYSKWTITRSVILALYYFFTKQKPTSAKTLPFWYDGRR